MALDYKVGDKVQSHPNSSDVTGMKAVWVGEIVEIVTDNDSGGCYITHGSWHPIVTDGTVHDFWKDRMLSEDQDPLHITDVKAPTSRQLYGDHLVLR